MNKVLGELELSLSGISDPKAAKEVGKMLAADAIVVGTVSEVGNDFLINIRLVDVEKAVILAAASTNMKIKKKDFFAEAALILKQATGTEYSITLMRWMLQYICIPR